MDESPSSSAALTEQVRGALSLGILRSPNLCDRVFVDALAALDALAEALAEAEKERDAYREALLPFANGSAAFDDADSTYGRGPVFERFAKSTRWFFTIADVRRAAALAAGRDGGHSPRTSVYTEPVEDLYREIPGNGDGGQ